ncbi:PD40 domain-containing protein [Neorhizobium sp. JUb45]|uniref:TolB family protein n=1 Tax=Neorhizobium sp. JUb45 TaxID=2485113 RepID=UPI001047D0FD|nr:PD40 domain-containing protein [Neorhizobium sp. JUb45]TCQ97318.1 WD40 repeat protein [Neorhizobium sp. JUb45]
MTDNVKSDSVTELSVQNYGRQLAPGQRSLLAIHDLATGERQVILETDHLIEAPNWTPDGDHLIFNGGGQLWRIGVDGLGLQLINTGMLADLNNDHVLSPDGRAIYVSSNDGHLYKIGFDAGPPVRVSNRHDEPFRYYLHGVSPDEQELAYVGIEGTGPEARRNLYVIPAAGGTDRRLLDSAKPSDGPEYSPDGQWIYFSSELRSSEPGHAQVFRMDRDGDEISQFTFDNRVNWFPHISPDGQTILFLSYPAGTIGHPPDKDVIIRSMTVAGEDIKDVVAFHGGQGTINVNSWAPDSRRFAYVEYPLG